MNFLSGSGDSRAIWQAKRISPRQHKLHPTPTPKSRPITLPPNLPLVPALEILVLVRMDLLFIMAPVQKINTFFLLQQ